MWLVSHSAGSAERSPWIVAGGEHPYDDAVISQCAEAEAEQQYALRFCFNLYAIKKQPLPYTQRSFFVYDEYILDADLVTADRWRIPNERNLC